MRTRLLALALLLAAAVPASAVPNPSREDAQQQIQMSPGDMPFQMLPPGRQPKTGTGRLRGRVQAADTGTILRRAMVRISSPDIGSKSAMTDAQGRYEFKDLPAGRFTLSVSKSGFVTMQYGQSRPFEPGRPIELAEAQIMDKADMALPRGSAVSGRILDEFGEPVADASVTAMRSVYSGGRRRLSPAGRPSMTNDLGTFRVFGLPPGEYYLSASLRTIDSMVMDMLGASSAGGPTGSNNNSGYAATYYPGTPNPAEAQRISLGVGQEMTTVELQMAPVRLAKISGIASGSDGKPMSGALVMLMPSMRESVAMIPGGTSRTDKDGNFTLNGVAPGDYSLQVQSMAALMSAASHAMSMINGGDGAAAGAPVAPVEREFATANVSVTGEDITNLIVAGTRGAKVRGRLIFEGQRPDTIATLRLIAAPTDTDNMPAAASIFGMSMVKEDGTFEMDGLVGGRSLRIMNMPKGWYLKQVTREGADLTDKGFDFKPGQDIEGFDVVLTQKTQTVTGAVSNARGEPAKEYTVVVFPEDPQMWTLASDRWKHSARPDQQGQFKITDLPAGAYLAVAVEYVPQGDWEDPAWLARAAKSATQFTLDEGATKTLALKIAGS